MNASVNAERVLITISGSFGGIQKNFVKVAVRFPLSNQHEYFCTIETIQMERLQPRILKSLIDLSRFSLTCNLLIPKQPMEGVISIDIQPGKILSIGDTDVSGTVEFPEKFSVYVSVLFRAASEE